MPRESGAPSRHRAGARAELRNKGRRLLGRPPSRAMTMERQRDLVTRAAILVPYAWLIAFFLAPFLIVLKIGFSQTAIAQPPYTPVLDIAAGWEGIKEFISALSADNYATLFTDSLYLWSYLKSLQVAAISTVILLLIAYPVAYALARAPRRWQEIGRA